MTSTHCECQSSCCEQGNTNHPYFVNRTQKTDAGDVPIVSTNWRHKERIGSWKARWGINRMDYTIEPGLYGTGTPSPDSPVMISANYKMSFDHLRRSLKGIDAWILVLDTKGINVWCAAGKGTFGTEELINRIKTHQLDKLVNHKKIIVPQLGAVGVAAHEITKQTKFKVVYGPVQAKDISQFIENNFECKEEMRRVQFPLKDRIVLSPMELVPSIKYFLIVAAVLFLIKLISGQPIIPDFFMELLPYLASIMIGSIFVPALLPWIPFRSFALKGMLLALVYVLILHQFTNPTLLNRIAQLLVIPSLSSFIAVNFTGSTTYTSLSGVQKELAWGIPIYIGAGIIAVTLTTIDAFV